MDNIFSLLFPILLFLIGVYVLVSAIRRSGKLFSTENLKDDSKEKATKIMRGLYFALAGIMLVMSVANGLQTVLYSKSLTYYRVTDAYKETFPDLLENGQLTYEATNNAGYGMSCMGGSTGTGEKITYGPYSVDNQKMDMQEVSAFINKAYSVYSADRTKFPLVSGGLMSCGGSTVDYSKYYQQTSLIDDAGEPVYAQTDAEKAKGHAVYTSTFGNVRSDANDGSFLSKLYGFLSPTLLTILNYVFLGLAIVLAVLVFFVIRKFTDKEKLEKARAQTQGYQSSMPSSAFNFDDLETKEAPKKK